MFSRLKRLDTCARDANNLWHSAFSVKNNLVKIYQRYFDALSRLEKNPNDELARKEFLKALKLERRYLRIILTKGVTEGRRIVLRCNSALLKERKNPVAHVILQALVEIRDIMNYAKLEVERMQERNSEYQKKFESDEANWHLANQMQIELREEKRKVEQAVGIHFDRMISYFRDMGPASQQVETNILTAKAGAAVAGSATASVSFYVTASKLFEDTVSQHLPAEEAYAEAQRLLVETLNDPIILAAFAVLCLAGGVAGWIASLMIENFPTGGEATY